MKKTSLLSVETRKQRGHFQFLLLLIPVIMTILWVIPRTGKNEDVWGVLLFQCPLMNSVFLPVFTALFASRLMDIEHRGDTWKTLYTMVHPRSIFIAKIMYGTIMISAALILQSIFLFCFGAINHPATPMPAGRLLWVLVTNVLVTEILFILHAMTAFFARQQAPCVIMGILGSFLGMLLDLLPLGAAQRLIPWGLYISTISLRMDWYPDKKLVEFVHISLPVKDLIICLLWLLVLSVCASIMLRKGNTDEHSFILKTSSYGASGRSKHLRVPTELAKMRQPAVWLALFMLPLISSLIGTANYLGNIDVLRSGWYSLWSQLTLFLDYFFAPALIGVIASCIWRTEHTGTNWNQLLASASVVRIVLEKYAAAMFFSTISVIWTAALFLICGNIAGIKEPLPHVLTEWVICGIIGSWCVAGVQLLLSLLIRNFTIPIGLAFAGSVLGLGLTAKWGQTYILPYSLLAVGMRANNPFYVLDRTRFVFSAGIQLILWPLLAMIYIRNSDVKSHE